MDYIEQYTIDRNSYMTLQPVCLRAVSSSIIVQRKIDDVADLFGFELALFVRSRPSLRLLQERSAYAHGGSSKIYVPPRRDRLRRPKARSRPDGLSVQIADV